MVNFILAFLLVLNFSFAHSVQYSVNNQKAIVIKIFFADGTPFSYEKYEIYSPDNIKVPYQVGRTDQYGRVIFIPDRTGNWTIKAFSEDGHGIIKKIHINNISTTHENPQQFSYLLKIFIGVLIILSVYLLFYLSNRREKIEKAD